MRIDEILKRKRTLSFEVFPPKREGTEKEALYRAIDALKALRPDFVSVTYGASGSNARGAAEIAGHLKSVGLEPLAHLTGGPSTPAEIDAVLGDFRRMGVENLLALRGDRPADSTVPYGRHFAHATDLMRYIEGDFCIGGACYPEGHAESETLYDDLVYLKMKQDCGAKFLITQLFYDNSYYYRLLYEAQRAGVTVPIIPGIMPITSVKSIDRIKLMCGSAIPLEFRNMIETYRGHPAAMREVGLNYAAYQIVDLIAKGAPGIHLYIMNNAETAVQLVTRLQNVLHDYF